MRGFLFLFFIAALCISSVECWWCEGHIVTALVAYKHMKPNTKKAVNKLFSQFSKTGPFRLTPDYYQAVCWADDLKGSEKLYAMAIWHWIDIPYFQNKSKPFPIEHVNVVTMLDSLMETARRQLEIRRHHHGRFKRIDNFWTLNFVFGNIVHFLGDIHQPLHASTRVVERHGKLFADKGGNMIWIKARGRTMRLHALWDAVCDPSETWLKRPLKGHSWDPIKKLAYKIDEVAKNITKEDANVVDPMKMAEQSHSYAKYVYNSIPDSAFNNTWEDPVLINEKYLDTCSVIAHRQLARAGLRMAHILDEYFEKCGTKCIPNIPWAFWL